MRPASLNTLKPTGNATEMPTSDESSNTNGPGSGVSAGKLLSPVFEIANPISAIKKKIEMHFVNSQKSNSSDMQMDIENWEEIKTHFKSLDTLAPDELLNIRPPTPIIRINNIEVGENDGSINASTLRSFADYFHAFWGNSESSVTVTRLTKTALVGTQLRIYVQKRRAIMMGTGKRNPRNMMRDMVTKIKFAETDIKRMMLWSRLTQIMPGLLVTGKTLFGWVFESSSAITDKRVEDFLLERTLQEKTASTTSIMADNIRFDILMRSNETGES